MTGTSVLAGLLAGVLPLGPGSGFDQAIETAVARTVKLYGLGAGRQPGYGSGIVVSPNGQILTVLSILIDSSNIRAVTADGGRYRAEVIFRDGDRQMALLQLQAADGPAGGLPRLASFAEGNSSSLRPGDWVIAAGNAFKVADGVEPVPVALGVFSGRTEVDARRRRRDYAFGGEVLVIDAITSNPGVPGGPLVDLEGKWVGMMGRVVVSNVTHTQFNHAFPVELCMEFLRQARDPTLRRELGQAGDSELQRRRIDPGIKLFELGYRKKLVYVEKVAPASPAA
ncbi:MAG: S1C family serine protease, partial [Planctomycetota bacterium]